MSEVLRHVQSNSLGSILTEDGKPNLENIRRLEHVHETLCANCTTIKLWITLLIKSFYERWVSNVICKCGTCSSIIYAFCDGACVLIFPLFLHETTAYLNRLILTEIIIYHKQN